MKPKVACLFLCLVTGPCVGTGTISSLPSSTATKLPREELNRIADDPTATRDERAAAVFALFKRHIKPGDNAGQVRRVMGEAKWVDEAKIYPFTGGAFGGHIPVELNFEDETYSLHLFPDTEGISNWVIYFVLAGRSESTKCIEDAFAFLRAGAGSKGEGRLKEFALCYPDGETDITKKRKPRLFVAGLALIRQRIFVHTRRDSAPRAPSTVVHLVGRKGWRWWRVTHGAYRGAEATNFTNGQ